MNSKRKKNEKQKKEKEINNIEIIITIKFFFKF